MPDSKRIATVRAIILATIFLALGALYEYIQLAIDEGVFFMSSRRMIGIWLGISICGLLIALFLVSLIQNGARVLQLLDTVSSCFSGKRVLGAIAITIITAIVVLAVRSYYGRYFLGFSSRGMVLWIGTLLGYGVLSSCYEWKHRAYPLAMAWLFLGMGFHASDFIASVSTTPFSLSWSEGSRNYYASLFYAERVYGQYVSPPYFDASRHLLQSLPFLISGIPLWVHRLWQSLMWIGFPVIVAILITRRLDRKDNTHRLLFIVWSLFFLLLGPVPYQVLVVPILVFLGFDRDKPGQSLLVIAAAAIWAGFSRFNWAPMAGIIAAITYILETPYKHKNIRSLIRYIKSPVIWVILSMVVALITQISYLYIVGYRDPTYITYTLYQKLLWYRLLPNETFSPGIILAVAIISIPLILLMGINMREWRKRWHWLRPGSLGVVLLVFILGGLLASTKIGGGTNIHNMDGFILLLYIVGVYIYGGSFVPDRVESSRPTRSPPILMTLILAVPILYMMPGWGPLEFPDVGQAERDLNNLRSLVNEVAQDGGDILFLSERQLLAHNRIEEVQLIPDYEKMFLMEMAMAENTQLLAPFHEDIAAQRFELIVSEPLYTVVKVEGSISLAEENNAWVRYVAKPILCNYAPWLTFEESQVQLLVPRERSICE